MKILLTAFDPFGGETTNPALEAIKQIPDRLGELEITKLTVPTIFGKSLEVVKAELEKLHPDAVICVGQAGGRTGITIERVAINCMDAAIADNEGNKPIDEAVIPEGNAAYFSTLPIKEMVAAIKAEGIPASVSNTAGTFVCNQLMYGVLHMIEKLGWNTKAGFIHVPYIPSQAAAKEVVPASMALEDIVKGLKAGILALL